MSATTPPATPATGLNLTDLLSGAQPLDAAALHTIADTLATATVVGVGDATRFAHESFIARDLISRILFADHGFRGLVIQDSGDVADELDAFVRTGTGNGADALTNAWGPWRSMEMAAALEWIRDFNRSHADNPIRILSIRPPQAQSADYDAVLTAVQEYAPSELPALNAHLTPIRTAHTVDEHVQRAKGFHPGRPFAEHARDAATLLRAIPELPADISGHMQLIVDFHENSVAGRGSFASDEGALAAHLIAQQTATGLRLIFWDGIAHVSAAPTSFGDTDEGHDTVGSVLREHYGAGYSAIAFGFHHGDLGITRVPAPPSDFLDAVLGSVPLAAHWIDLRPYPALTGATKLRVISGVYDADRDDEAYVRVSSLRSGFDVVVHVHEPTALSWLS
ncbi:erythromycin esterase family protein [Nocardia sp. NPDC057668]|uniref:erythromycin esterase family protein n=1 Tax=Nocardia sp. NPDC057668 TaxID=3346202 RepID=UPI00367119DB